MAYLKHLWLVLGAFCMLAACAKEPASISQSASACPSEAAPLPGSGICPIRGINYLEIADGPQRPLPEGCVWALNETALPAGEYLLYLAAQCDGVTSKLEFSGGARSAVLHLAVSALGVPRSEASPLVRMIGAPGVNPRATLAAWAKKADAKDPSCQARLANIEGWPQDAWVVDTTPPTAIGAEPNSACGTYGYDQSKTAYWRVFQDFAWFFNLGQDAYIDIDPRSLTIVTLAAPKG